MKKSIFILFVVCLSFNLKADYISLACDSNAIELYKNDKFWDNPQIVFSATDVIPDRKISQKEINEGWGEPITWTLSVNGTNLIEGIGNKGKFFDSKNYNVTLKTIMIDGSPSGYIIKTKNSKIYEFKLPGDCDSEDPAGTFQIFDKNLKPLGNPIFCFCTLC